jgi:hypothetical protein
MRKNVMTKLTLIKSIDRAIAGSYAIGCVIEIKNLETGFIGFEFIINSVQNLKEKRKYYFSSYDEDCRLAANPNAIRIVAVYEGTEAILKNLTDYLNAK